MSFTISENLRDILLDQTAIIEKKIEEVQELNSVKEFVSAIRSIQHYKS